MNIAKDVQESGGGGGMKGSLPLQALKPLNFITKIHKINPLKSFEIPHFTPTK